MFCWNYSWYVTSLEIGNVQSIQRRFTDWTVGVLFPEEARFLHFSAVFLPAPSPTNPHKPMVTGGDFVRGKVAGA
jgi:hypothetical protein